MTGRRTAAAAGLSALALLGAAGCGGGSDASSSALGHARAKRGKVPPGTTAANFSLRDAHGRTITLGALRGKVVLLTFLYTHCVDVCPGIAHELNETLRELGHQRRTVRVIAVSVDPAFDTPEAVRRFERTHRLLPEFHYLIGSRAELKPVWQDYNVLVVPRSSDLFGHSTPIYLIDKSGTPRYSYPSHAEPATLAGGARELLGSD